MSKYIGRFAPSPTGELHIGSLIAAVASYADAKSNSGRWLLRIDDLDKTREVAGSATLIEHTLHTFGFQWDHTITRQSQHVPHYDSYFQQLFSLNKTYPCQCSRKSIASIAKTGVDGFIYPNTCKFKQITTDSVAWRLDVSDSGMITATDLVQDSLKQDLTTEVGDFIIKRKDTYFAYQLAVVIDDYLHNINHVVRGADIYNSTPKQIHLQQLLGFPTPTYAHIPIATHNKGQKISKSEQAQSISCRDPMYSLNYAWDFLGQTALSAKTVSSFWQQAFQQWDINLVPKELSICSTQ